MQKPSLNSVLLDADLVGMKEKRDQTGWYLLVRSRARIECPAGGTTFRVEVPTALHQRLGGDLLKGRQVRILGRLAKASRMGVFVRAETLEVRPAAVGS